MLDGQLIWLGTNGFETNSDNMTLEWLRRHPRKSYLFGPAVGGRLSVEAAFYSALDDRPLNIRLAEWDKDRSHFGVPKKREC